MERVLIPLVILQATLTCGQLQQFPSTPSPFLYNFGTPAPPPSYFSQYPTPNNYFQPAFNPYYNPLPSPIPLRGYSNDRYVDDSYAVDSYSSTEGKRVQESGLLKNADLDKYGEPQGVQVIKGTYSYTAADGTPVQVSYVIDENGFRSTGVEIQAEEEKKAPMANTEDEEKEEEEEDNKKKIVFTDPFYRHRNSFIGYNPYFGNQFDYYNTNRYDPLRYNTYQSYRQAYEPVPPFTNSWINPYFNYNPYARRFKSTEEKRTSKQ